MIRARSVVIFRFQRDLPARNPGPLEFQNVSSSKILFVIIDLFRQWTSLAAAEDFALDRRAPAESPRAVLAPKRTRVRCVRRRSVMQRSE